MRLLLILQGGGRCVWNRDAARGSRSGDLRPSGHHEDAVTGRDSLFDSSSHSSSLEIQLCASCHFAFCSSERCIQFPAPLPSRVGFGSTREGNGS